MSDPAGRRRLLGHLQEHEADREPKGDPWPTRFRRIRELGRGGMGAVVLAHDAQLNRQVAVKVLLAAEGAALAQRQRLETEGKTLAALRHPNIVPVHELVRDQGALFLVMDYVEGESVAERMTKGKLCPREAARVGLAVAEALACAHERGVLHRDVKPSNILLSDDGGVFLVDFGLAKQIDSSVALTRTGQIMGTPDYLAPEQAADAKAVDERSDVYSLGASLFHMLTGQVVFPATNVPELLGQLVSSPPRDPREVDPRLPGDLATICLRCLQKEPTERYPDAKALADDLGAFLAGQPIHEARPRRRAVRALLGLAAVGVLLAGILAGVVATDGADTPSDVQDGGVAPSPQLVPARGPAAEGTQPAYPARQVLAHDDALDVTFVPGRQERIATAGSDGVRMWEAGAEERQLWARAQVGVTWLAASPDGRTLACGRYDAVDLLAGDDGRLLATVRVEKRTAVGLWLDEGRELLLGCDAPLGLQRVRTSDCALLPTRRVDYEIHCLAYDPRSAVVAWGGGRVDEVTPKRLDLSRGALEPQAKPLEGWVLAGCPRGLAPGRAPGEWVVGLTNGAIHILRQGQRSEDGGAPAGTALAAPPESFRGKVGVFQPTLAHVSRVVGLGFLYNGLLVSSSGRTLAGDLRVWDLEQTNPLIGLAIRDGLTIRAMQVSPDGRRVALATRHGGVLVLSAERVVEMARRNGTLLAE